MDYTGLLAALEVDPPSAFIFYNTIDGESSIQLQVTGTLTNGTEVDFTSTARGIQYASSDITMVEIFNTISTAWSNATNLPWGNDSVQAGPNEKDIVVTSGYRNPERNERVSSTPNSLHQSGRAVDIAPTPRPDNPSEERAVAFGNLWHVIESGAGASSPAEDWQLEVKGATILSKGGELIDEDGDGIPDIVINDQNLMEQIDHLHVEDENK